MSGQRTKHNIDIAFLQEVIDPTPIDMIGYTSYTNVGTNMRVTAILCKNDFPLTNVTKIPSGRAISATYQGIRLINIYAPSGTARKADREHFYSVYLTGELYTKAHSMIISGDFNCIFHPSDTTGQYNTSRALAELVRGLHLKDAWSQNSVHPTFTHHSPHQVHQG
jgi:exonuclease III